jgi:hypothetical protein
MRLSAVLLVVLSLAAAAQDRTYPFAVDQDHLTGAPDFSRLNHPLTPADRVFVKNGHFYTVGPDLKPNTADDQRLRLFGVNTAFGANFPEPEDAARIAKRLRRVGINLVRLHHMDSSPDRNPQDARSTLTTGPYPTLNQVSIARLRTFLDALKAEGIYVNLNLHVGYEFRPDIDHVPAVPGTDHLPTQSKPLHIFYPRMIDLQAEYAKKLIDALKLKNDPVLAMVEIDNETSLVDSWQRNSLDRLVTGEYRDELDRQKKAFLKDRPDSTDMTIEFLVDRDRAYLRRLLAVVREATDVFVPVTGTQVGFGGLLNYDSHQDLDYQDNHFYIDHYNFPNRRWDGRDWRQRNTTSSSTGFATYLNMAATREAGRPFTISEFNQPFPNSYAAEIDPTLAAFAAFQDWDALMHFAREHGREWDRGGPSGFNLNGDWTKWPNVGQSAWIFRTGAVAAAKEEVRIPLPHEARLDSACKKTNGSATTFLKSSQNYDANVAFVHRVSMDTKAGGALPETAKSVAAPYRADTGELTFDPARRLLRIEAPQVAGIFGFIGDAPATAGPVTVESHGFIAFLLTALDNRPLDQSARMLLSLPGPGPKLIPYPGTSDWWTLSSPDEHPSGTYVVKGPLQMEGTDTILQLRGVTVYPLDGSGKRQAPLERGNRIHLNAATPWYELTR